MPATSVGESAPPAAGQSIPPAPSAAALEPRPLSELSKDRLVGPILSKFESCMEELHQKTPDHMSDFAHYYQCSECSGVCSYFGKSFHALLCPKGAKDASSLSEISLNDYQNKVIRGVTSAGARGPFLEDLQAILKKFNEDARKVVESFPAAPTEVTYYQCRKCEFVMTHYLVLSHSVMCRPHRLLEHPQFEHITEERYQEGVRSGKYVPDKKEEERRRQLECDLMAVEDELSQVLNRGAKRCCVVA